MISNEAEPLEDNARRLKRVVLRFPQNDSEANAFFTDLGALLQLARNCRQRAGMPVLLPDDPEGALPFIVLEQEEIDFPAVMLDTAEPIELNAGGLPITSAAAAGRALNTAPGGGKAERKAAPLSILVRALSGAVRFTDHVAINFPPAAVTQAQWDALLARLSPICAIYRRPGALPHAVILPATRAELEGEIQRFRPGRAPKLVLVIDGLEQQPGLHFALQTELTRAEIAARLPAPYGFELGESYRAVYAQTPWDGFLLRIDLLYKTGISAWQTGESIVREGGRITA